MIATEHQWLIPFLSFCRNKANGLRIDAGYSGAMNDGGASRLEDAVNAFEAGLQGIIPECLMKHYQEYQRANDPEWAELQRLGKKFGIKVD